MKIKACQDYHPSSRSSRCPPPKSARGKFFVQKDRDNLRGDRRRDDVHAWRRHGGGAASHAISQPRRASRAPAGKRRAAVRALATPRLDPLRALAPLRALFPFRAFTPCRSSAFDGDVPRQSVLGLWRADGPRLVLWRWRTDGGRRPGWGRDVRSSLASVRHARPCHQPRECPPRGAHGQRSRTVRARPYRRRVGRRGRRPWNATHWDGAGERAGRRAQLVCDGRLPCFG